MSSCWPCDNSSSGMAHHSKSYDNGTNFVRGGWELREAFKGMLARKKISFQFISCVHNILVEPGNGRYNPRREHSGLSSKSK